MKQSRRKRKNGGVKRNKGKNALMILVRKAKKNQLQELRLDKRIILKWVMQKEDTRNYSTSICLEIWISGDNEY